MGMPSRWQVFALIAAAQGGFTTLLHLPPMDGHSDQPRVKSGPALAGHGAEAVRDAIAATIGTLPPQFRRSLTWDQGAEMAQRASCASTPDWPSTSATRTALAAWDKREHKWPTTPIFPKARTSAGTAVTTLKLVQLPKWAAPKKFKWKATAEAFNNLLFSIQQASFATTG